ncbi:glucose-6-phosphate dehydrogenase [Spirosoma telluris]|uniref:glucose-6-phosphate dehydrogenase n=1 Tax=Spirosoma telluris TaxID=2183553 RepID=UPI002FC369EE
MERFRNKYRIASARAAWWDYGWAGAYFITICTAQRHHYFGNIDQGQMKLSSVGILADVFSHEIRHHSQLVELGTFVVMPNHIHGILILTGGNGNRDHDVDTRHALSLPPPPPN